jgi:hypothetical protein
MEKLVYAIALTGRVVCAIVVGMVAGYALAALLLVLL